MSQHGEPWAEREWLVGIGIHQNKYHVPVMTDANANVLLVLSDWRGSEEQYHHMLACVNALAKRDPGRLGELEAAVEDAVKEFESVGWNVTEAVRLKAALAAFRIEPKQQVKEVDADGK